MGFFSECAIDIANGMPKDKAISINAKLRYGNLTEEEKKQINAEGEADIKLNSML